MRRGGLTKLGMILLVLILAGVLIWAVFWIGERLFSEEIKPAELTAAQKLVIDPTDKTSIKMIVRGPITAQERHYSMEFSISPSSRRIEAWRGYAGEKLVDKNLTNSQAAFNDFMAIMEREKFMNSSNSKLSTEGICMNGQLIVFQIFNNTEKVGELWTTSCNDKGTFAGNNQVIDIILNQIPGSRQIVVEVKKAVGAPLSSGNLFAL